MGDNLKVIVTVNNNDLLYSTRKYTPYFIITYMVEESKKECICV